MSGLATLVGRRPDGTGSPLFPGPMAQLCRLSEAAGFSMVSLEDEDERAEPLVIPTGKPACTDAIAGRLAALIEGCTRLRYGRIWRTAT